MFLIAFTYSILKSKLCSVAAAGPTAYSRNLMIVVNPKYRFVTRSAQASKKLQSLAAVPSVDEAICPPPGIRRRRSGQPTETDVSARKCWAA